MRKISDQLSAGLAVYGNGGMNTDYGVNPFAAFGSTGSAGVDLEQLFITPSVAYKPNPDHGFGVGLTYAYQRFEMKGVSAFDNPFFSAAPGSVSNKGQGSIPMPFGGGEANIHLQEDLLSIGYSYSL